MKPDPLPQVGWSHRKTGKSAVVRCESADGTVWYRYKGARRQYGTPRAKFLAAFTR
jgi:hypothetical protein